jgi:multiple sugar transport system ATP-binding protein
VASVSFAHVSKTFSDGTRAVDDLTLDVESGEFLVLVGPSGCGKTTALRMLAGLEDATAGEMRIGDMVVNDFEARDRNIAMVFQSYALYPHMTVRENMAFGLEARGVNRKWAREKVTEVAEVLGLSEVLHRKPRELSGGQRQRVAMGRAIVRDPAVFLMDEPLSNLDAKLRVQMRAEITRIQRQLNATTLYVTHDQVEAMTMADRVAIMRRGRLQQLGPPQVLYDAPANLFVASFIGSPQMNLVQARLERSKDGLACRVGSDLIALSDATAAKAPTLANYVGEEVALGIRPEDLAIGVAANGDRPDVILGRVVLYESLGAEAVVHVECQGMPVASDEVVEVAQDVDVAVADELRAGASTGSVVLRARASVGRAVRLDDRLALVVDTDRLHFFDLATGKRLTGAA